MANLERQDDILSILAKEKTISVKKLAEILYVSEATVRRDLVHMNNLGLLRRTHGGAMIAQDAAHESAFAMREVANIGAKKLICGLAIQQLHNQDVVFMDSSSTMLPLIPLLQRFNRMSVVTHGIRTGLLLSNLENIEVFLAGGKVANFSNSILGSSVINFYDQINADVSLLSSSGINLDGNITDNNIDHAMLKQKMINKSKRVILLIDHSKFDKTFMTSSFKLSDVDLVITDKKPSLAYIELIKNAGCELVYPQ